MFNRCLFALILIMLSLPSYSAGKLLVKNAWVREAPPLAKNLAGYAELRNIGDELLELVSLSSQMFEKIQMHVTSIENGQMRMKHVETLKILPGETIYFEPGDKHFMLVKPKQRISVGLIVPIQVNFSSGNSVLIELPVKK